MLKTIVLVGLIVLFAGTQANAEEMPVGTYEAVGWEPGQDRSKDAPYHGTAILEARGDALTFRGDIDGHKYNGVGIYDPETGTLALHFIEDETGKTGVALFEHRDEVLDGVWAWMDEADGKLGKEVWVFKHSGSAN